MKLYPQIDVSLTHQNLGSNWLMVMRGNEENILLVFNGLWNYGATSGELEFTDHVKTTATFWSNEEKMTRFFYNLHESRHGVKSLAKDFAAKQIAALKLENIQFMERVKVYAPDAFVTGKTRAERPDHDMKDALLFNAMKDRSE